MAKRAPRHVLGFHYRNFANPSVSGEYKKWFNPPVDGVASERCAHHPLLGFYDSLDPAVITQHAVCAREAGLTGLIFGYWMRDGWEGRGYGAAMLDALHRQGLTLTVYLEKQAGGVEGALADFRYLHDNGLQHPAWLRVGGRPVFLFYGGAFRQLPAEQWRAAARAYAADGRPEPLLIGDVDPEKPGYAETARWLDGTHHYTLSDRLTGKTPAEIAAWAAGRYPAWASQAGAGKIRCSTVEPGWNDLKVADRKPPRPTVDRFGTATLEALWTAALNVDPDWVIVSTFNDWSNGTEIEPSREYGRAALELNAKYARRFLASG